MSIPRCPRPKDILQAVVSSDPGAVTNEQAGQLLRIWPKESPISDMPRELESNEIWDKAEAYMIQLVEMGSLENRLKMWAFRANWRDEKEFTEDQVKQMNLLFDYLRSDKYFNKILGMILAIGNVMNGGTPKG